MTKVLITGATGNVGREVLNALMKMEHSLEIFAGVKDKVKDKSRLANSSINYVHFDFSDFTSYDAALRNCDILFLLRPPQLSEVEKYFTPVVNACKLAGVKHIIFLSVQGVESSKIIPHHKIEKLIVESGITYTFLRPAYFMQNFSSTLQNDLVNKKLIYLPAGKAKFTLIDVADIGAVTANIVTQLKEHINKSYELTCYEKLTFSEMAHILSEKLGTEIRYISPNLLSFYRTKRKEKVPTMIILVMIMLHYLPRFKKEPRTTDWVQKITKQAPKTFEQFVVENKNLLC